MPKTTRRLSPARVGAVAISCTALIALAIAPVFASSSIGATSQLRHAQVQSVATDADQRPDLDPAIDTGDAPETDEVAETETPDPDEASETEAADTEEATAPEPAETTVAEDDQGEDNDDQGDDNDDQGENEQTDVDEADHDAGAAGDQEDASDAGEHDGDESGDD
jgi:hypothetical protein